MDKQILCLLLLIHSVEQQVTQVRIQQIIIISLFLIQVIQNLLLQQIDGLKVMAMVGQRQHYHLHGLYSEHQLKVLYQKLLQLIHFMKVNTTYGCMQRIKLVTKLLYIKFISGQIRQILHLLLRLQKILQILQQQIIML